MSGIIDDSLFKVHRAIFVLLNINNCVVITSYLIMLTSKHVLGTYTLTKVSKDAFKKHMCLLRTYRHGCQIYKLRVQLGLDRGSDWSV